MYPILCKDIDNCASAAICYFCKQKYCQDEAKSGNGSFKFCSVECESGDPDDEDFISHRVMIWNEFYELKSKERYWYENKDSIIEDYKQCLINVIPFGFEYIKNQIPKKETFVQRGIRTSKLSKCSFCDLNYRNLTNDNGYCSDICKFISEQQYIPTEFKSEFKFIRSYEGPYY